MKPLNLCLSWKGWGGADGQSMGTRPRHNWNQASRCRTRHSAAARGRTSLARFPSLPRNSSQKRYQVVAPPLPAFLEIFTIWDKQSDFSFILKSVGEKTLLCIYRTFTTLEPGDSIALPSPLELPAWAPQRPEDPLLRGPQLDVSPGRGSGPFPGSSLGFLSLKALVRNR